MRKRWILLPCLLVSGALLLLTAVLMPAFASGSFHEGSAAGVLMALGLLSYAVLGRQINALLAAVWRTGPGRAVLIVLAVLALVILLASCWFLWQIAAHGVRQEDDSVDAVLVLGCQVHGTVPGSFLRRRIAAASEYLKRHPDAIAVLCGGQGPGEGIAEAECMFRELTALGIDPARLIVEDQSKSTSQNFANAVALLRQRGLPAHRFAVVTNDFHQYRAGLIAADKGFEAVPFSAETPKSGLLPSVLRELLGCAYHFVFGQKE